MILFRSISLVRMVFYDARNVAIDSRILDRLRDNNDIMVHGNFHH